LRRRGSGQRGGGDAVRWKGRQLAGSATFSSSEGGEEGEGQSCAQQRRRRKLKGAAAAVSFVSAFRVLATLNY